MMTSNPCRPSAIRLSLASAVSLAALLTAVAAQAQTPTPLPAVSVNVEQPVLCPLDSSSSDAARLAWQRAVTDDTAQLLASQPGVAMQIAGGVSALPSMHGFNDDRLRVEFDGMALPASCPNHMNPVLSYAAPGAIGSVQVIPGVTPVSLGGDSIGGTIRVDSAKPLFADGAGKIRWDGVASAFFNSNGSGISTTGSLNAATDTLSLGYTGSFAKSDDYTSGSNKIVRSTKFESINHLVTAAMRSNSSELVIKGGVQSTPYEAYPSQPMDLMGNHSTFINADLTHDLGWGQLDVRAYGQWVEHYMNFLPEKGGDLTGGMPMHTRSTDFGYHAQLSFEPAPRQTIRVGLDGQFYSLNDWWPAASAKSMMMGPGQFDNINNGTRDRNGAFAEWEDHFAPGWTAQIGGRLDLVQMNTGDVQPYSWTSMMQATDIASAKAFNAASHAKTDVNFDATALARYDATDSLSTEFAYARKTRSPNLYERYAWDKGAMASLMIGWFGDYNGYVGNINLKPEVANTFATSIVLHQAASKNGWELKLTPYYSYVQDYIGANDIGTVGPNRHLLQFANHDAQTYGLDVSGHAGLFDNTAIGQIGLDGVIGWVQGQYIDTGKSLYGVMPFNVRTTLTQHLGGWSSAIELQLVAPKALVDSTREELPTPGYALVGLRTAYEWQQVRLDLALQNALNQKYYAPLGGVDYGDYRFAGRVGPITALPMPGRALIAGVTIKL